MSTFITIPSDAETAGLTLRAVQHLEVTQDELESSFADLLDEIYPEVTVFGVTISPSRVLRECDPVAFRQGVLAHEDDEQYREVDLDDFPDWKDSDIERYMGRLTRLAEVFGIRLGYAHHDGSGDEPPTDSPFSGEWAGEPTQRDLYAFMAHHFNQATPNTSEDVTAEWVEQADTDDGEWVTVAEQAYFRMWED